MADEKKVDRPNPKNVGPTDAQLNQLKFDYAESEEEINGLRALLENYTNEKWIAAKKENQVLQVRSKRLIDALYALYSRVVLPINQNDFDRWLSPVITSLTEYCKQNKVDTKIWLNLTDKSVTDLLKK